MAESGGLENRCPAKRDRGFESYLLRCEDVPAHYEYVVTRLHFELSRKS